MKIVMWIGDEPNQRALANKINSQFPLSAIVLEKRVSIKKYNLKTIINKLLSKFILCFFIKFNMFNTNLSLFFVLISKS